MKISSLLTFVASGIFLTAPALAAPAPAELFGPPQASSVNKRAAGEEMYLVNCYNLPGKADYKMSQTAWYKSAYVPGSMRVPDDPHPVSWGSHFKWERGPTVHYDDGNYVVFRTSEVGGEDLNGQIAKNVYAGKIYNKYRWFTCYGAYDGSGNILYNDNRYGVRCLAIYRCL